MHEIDGFSGGQLKDGSSVPSLFSLPCLRVLLTQCACEPKTLRLGK
jgi:hypothetical protein